MQWSQYSQLFLVVSLSPNPDLQMRKEAWQSLASRGLHGACVIRDGMRAVDFLIGWICIGALATALPTALQKAWWLKVVE